MKQPIRQKQAKAKLRFQKLPTTAASVLNQWSPLRPQPLWRCPSLSNLWWRCVAMTVRVRKRQKALLPGAAMVDLGTGDSLEQVTVEVTEEEIVSRAAILPTVKTADPVWVMRPSAPSARRWNVPKCRCVNWRLKPMAKP